MRDFSKEVLNSSPYPYTEELDTATFTGWLFFYPYRIKINVQTTINYF